MPIVNSIVNPKIQLDLTNPSMTLLHRAGIAGLWMTLRQLEKQYSTPAERTGNLNWVLGRSSISLNWQGEDFTVLDWLFKESFQITDRGLICLTGLNPQAINIETRLSMHLGITNTFLQHNKFFESAGTESKDLIVDGIKITVEYKKAKSYAHQDFAKNLCNKNGELLNHVIGVTGWLYPGAVVRHFAFEKDTKFEESVVLAIALLFAPVACQYFFVRSRIQIKQTKYALVIPEVTNLELFAQSYGNLGNLSYKYFYVSSLGEAGLKCLSHPITKTNKNLYIKRCQVIFFGNVTWSKRQKTRMEIISVSATEKALFYYKLSCRYFPECRIISISEDEKSFIIGNYIQGIIADNLTNNLPWWVNFTVKSVQNNLFKDIFYQNQGFDNMIQKTEWDIESQKVYIQACHEALKKRYAKIYSYTKEDEYVQIERENIRITSQLGRCTNFENFRKFISEFWGKTGQLSTLEEHWQILLPIISGKTGWKIAKDLTFIALASYPRNKTKKDDTSKQAQESN
jgi:CRISPR-associated protein Cas8a1/Csx13